MGANLTTPTRRGKTDLRYTTKSPGTFRTLLHLFATAAVAGIAVAAATGGLVVWLTR